MAAEYRDKRTLITTVRGQYLSFATFPTPLLSHYPLPLNALPSQVNDGKENVRTKIYTGEALYEKKSIHMLKSIPKSKQPNR